MKNFHNHLYSFHTFHLVWTPISRICRTFISMRSLLYSWWNGNCQSNSFPWILPVPLLQTWTFSISHNVCRSLLLHLLMWAWDHTIHPLCVQCVVSVLICVTSVFSLLWCVHLQPTMILTLAFGSSRIWKVRTISHLTVVRQVSFTLLSSQTDGETFWVVKFRVVDQYDT